MRMEATFLLRLLACQVGDEEQETSRLENKANRSFIRKKMKLISKLGTEEHMESLGV